MKPWRSVLVEDFSWAEEGTPPMDEDAPSVFGDPAEGIGPWEVTAHDRHIYEAGFMAGYTLRNPEGAQLDHEADRLDRAAFDHRTCTCRERPPEDRPQAEARRAMSRHEGRRGEGAGLVDAGGAGSTLNRPSPIGHP